MRRNAKQGRRPEIVTASEIAAFVYCPEAWRLEHGQGLEAGGRAASRRAPDAACHTRAGTRAFYI